jgi:hypothetical protein
MESPEASDRRTRRELRAAAAEQRRGGTSSSGFPDPSSIKSSLDTKLTTASSPLAVETRTTGKGTDRSEGLFPFRDAAEKMMIPGKRRVKDERQQQLPITVAERLHSIVFGSQQVSREVLAQWCHQGFRWFSLSLSLSRGSFLLTHLKLRGCRIHHIVLPRFAFVVVYYATEGYMFWLSELRKLHLNGQRNHKGLLLQMCECQRNS